MWSDSKGKGGKEGSPKSKDGGGEATKPNATASGASSGGKSGGKGRNTKTKMKALAAQGLPSQDVAEASAKLEQDIIKAAQSLSQAQVKAEETKTLIEINRVPDSMVRSNPAETATASNLMRLPDSSNENLDEKMSSLWKSRVLGAYRANPRASQHILPAMPNNRGALEITDKARSDAQQAAMITLVDKMFDSFQNLAFEFNNVAQASDLELTWIRPTISRENISSWHQAAQVVSVFTGRISTRRWTMVVRGTLESVLAYVIPADKLLSFSNQPANFQPVIELIPMADGLTVRWSVLGRCVNQEELVNVYRALLDNMIRIAQDDAPSDCFIDLALYGIFLEGEGAGQGQQPNQPQQQVLGQDINYDAKYQQEFFKDDTAYPNAPNVSNKATSAAGSTVGSFASLAGPSFAPAPIAQAESFNETSSSADWKPVVRSVRGANPPVPPTPMAGQSQNVNDQQSSLPTTPGFNQDEPWKYGSTPLPQGQANPSISSFPSHSGPPGRSQSFAGSPGAAAPDRFPGDQNDEPPLPSLPAHLFEGLPPRAQNSPQSSQVLPNPPSSHPSPLAPWATPLAASSTSLPVVSPGASATSSSDGWKSAGISVPVPGSKAMQNLPPSPVPGYPSTLGSSFSGEPSPLGNSLVSPENFTSGSIRVDAIAREIAHSSVRLPPAIPGFEPYSIDEPKREPPKPKIEPLSQTQATLARADRVIDDSDIDTWPEESTEAQDKPWPKPREKAILDPDLYPEPEEKLEPAAIVETFSEQNAFINFDSESQIEEVTTESAEQDDPEIAALFEGEPVNVSDIAEEPIQIQTSRFSSPDPAYMAWLEPEPAREEPIISKQQEMEANLQSNASGVSSASPYIEAEQDLSNRNDDNDDHISPVFQAQIENPYEDRPGQYKERATEHVVEEGGEEEITQETAQGAPQGLQQGIAQEITQETAQGIPQGAPKSDQRSRAAIEEGFRQAQVASAVSHFEHISATEGSNADQAPSHFEHISATEGSNADQAPLVVVDAASPGTSISSVAPALSSRAVAAADHAVRSLKADMDRLLANLDNELEVISARGSEAFAKRDLKSAERMIKLAETLSEFKDSLSKLREDHGNDIS